MRIKEIISEAHHSIVKSLQMGPWMVHIDSHALVSAPVRDVSLSVLTALIRYAAYTPNMYDTVPVGRGAYLQDLNTRASIYVKRVSQDELRIETVLGPDMRPSEPLFRRPIPAANVRIDPRDARRQALVKQQALERGRDAVSQDMEQFKDLAPQNRHQRRALDKFMRQRGQVVKKPQ